MGRKRANGQSGFIADAHLGGLAQMLRMAGFDTLYDNHCADAEIASVAVRDGRVVLTRDRELLKRREVTHGCYVHARKSAEQLREVFERLNLARAVRPFTRCLSCNVPLSDIPKPQVEACVPPRVYARYSRFLTCDACGRVFWEGSHWQQMSALLAPLLDAEG